MSGQEWRLTVHTDPGLTAGVVSITTHFRAPTIEAARQRAADDASGRGPFTLEPVCPVCGYLIRLGTPLSLTAGPDHGADVYTHPRCARKAGRR